MSDTLVRLREVEELVHDAFMEAIPSLAISKVVVTPRHDDEEIVDVLAYVPFRSESVTTSELLRLPSMAREAMRAAGDERYPSVDTRLSKGQKVKQG